MMNDFERQWEQLKSKPHLGGRLRVYPDHLLDFFVDYSLSGHKELLIEAKGIFYKFPDLPFFENLEVIFETTAVGAKIGLTLIDEHLHKNFSVMCFDLAERSKCSDNIQKAFSIVNDCLQDWSQLFKRRGKTGLSRSEVIGLWGELFSLEALVTSCAGTDELIVQSWRGPNGDQRDIGFNKTRIEVKTQLATKGIGLRVSSLDQLDDNGESLKVFLNRISPSDRGCSVAELAARLMLRFRENRIAHSEFERKLMLAGFDEELEIFDEKFDIDELIIYEVVDSFPKLTLSTVPIGIKAAEYEISGAAISDYQISWDKFLESLNVRS